jgi:hypothetical protein
MKSRLALLVLAATLSSPRLAIAQVQPTARPGMPKSIERSSEPRLQSSNAGIRFTSILSFPTANSRRPSLSPRRLRARLDVQTAIAHTGVVGILKGAMPGPVVAVRSELDALPVTEDTALPMELRQARANDPTHQDVPGIKTGLLVVSYVAAGKVSYLEAKFDVTLSREMRELRKQMVIELNQWSEKVEHKFDPMEWLRTASVEELRAALPAMRAERERLGLPAPPKLKPN